MKNMLLSIWIRIAVLAALALVSCVPAQLPTSIQPAANEPTQTPFVVRETVVVVISATPQPSSTTSAPGATQAPEKPSATPRPSPTSLVLLNIPVEGGDPNNKFFASLVFPDFRPAATRSLWFRVYAHKPVNATQDGEGIASVDFRIVNSNGEVVYKRQEKQAGYCAFGGGEPDCTIFDFAANKFLWPDGKKIISGAYTIEVTATAKDNSVMTGEAEFNIKVP